MQFFYRCRFISVNNSKQKILLPIVQIDNATLESFLRYQIKYKNRGKTWHKDSVSAMVPLLEFCLATEGDYANPKQMFEALSVAIRYDTVNRDQSDETGLRWEPKYPDRSNTLFCRLTAHSDWLCEETGDKSALLNPQREASKSERIINLAAYHHKKKNSFLKYTDDDSKAETKQKKHRSIGKNKTVPTTAATFKFPKKHTWNLIDNEFIKTGSRPDNPQAFESSKRVNHTVVAKFLLI